MSRRFLAMPLPSIDEIAVLSQTVSHHLLRVVQVPRGSRVVLFDGQGLEAEGELIGVEDGLARVQLCEDPRPVRSGHGLILLVGLPKKPAWDHSLRMATELGVTEIRAFPAHRSVVRSARPERWGRIVEAAAAQCGRGDVPRLVAFDHLSQALVTLPAQRLVCVPGAPLRGVLDADTALLLGPEGGLTDLEVQQARAAGFEAFGLSRWTLRADTAVAAALALLGAAQSP
jgi:16S rRNA (uracil1498-N3)-methyltransferase